MEKLDRGKNRLDEVEQDKKKRGTSSSHEIARYQKEWRGVLLKANVHSRL